MTSHHCVRAVTLSAALFASILAAAPAGAATHRTYALGPLRVVHPWIPPTPNAAPTAAGYLTITNTGKLADRLVEISSPAAAEVEPHHMSMAHGIMSMRPIMGGAAIGPGQSLTFAPGGDHLMLIGLKRPLTAGQHVPASLHFEHAGRLNIEFVVEPRPAATASMPGMDMH